jgi:hypothetical protein
MRRVLRQRPPGARGRHARRRASLDNNHIAGPRALDCSDGRVSPPEDAVPFLEMLVGNGRAID